MKRNFTIKAFLVISTLTLIVLSGCTPKMKTVKLSHTFFNFDAHVWVKDSVNDFHLDMCCLDTSQVTWDYFKPLEGPGRFEHKFRKLPICCGSRVIWEFRPAMQYCQWVHFGIGFEHNPCVRPIGATWSYNGKPVARVPFTMQIWLVEEGRLLKDVIMNPKYCYPDCERPKMMKDITGPVVIGRSWTFSERVFELPELMWGNKELAELKWSKEEIVKLPVDGKTELVIEDAINHKAVLVKYWVYSPMINDTIAHFINEAVIEQE